MILEQHALCGQPAPDPVGCGEVASTPCVMPILDQMLDLLDRHGRLRVFSMPQANHAEHLIELVEGVPDDRHVARPDLTQIDGRIQCTDELVNHPQSSGRVQVVLHRRRKRLPALIDAHVDGRMRSRLGDLVDASQEVREAAQRLLRLPEPVLRDVRSGTLSSGHARALINAPNPEALAEHIQKRGMSVRQAEVLVNKAIAARGAPRQPTAKKLDVADLERRVSDAIGCRVTITTARKGGGEISIQFRDFFQLEELIGRLTGERAKVELADQP